MLQGCVPNLVLTVDTCCDSQTGTDSPATCEYLSSYRAVLPRDPAIASNQCTHVRPSRSPSSTPSAAPQCNVPTSVLSESAAVGAFSPASVASVAGASFTLTHSSFQYCEHSVITIAKQDGAKFTPEEAHALRLSMHLFTSANQTGVACTSSADCKHLMRPLYLRLSADKAQLRGTVVPDSSSAHYVFHFQVMFGR